MNVQEAGSILRETGYVVEGRDDHILKFKNGQVSLKLVDDYEEKEYKDSLQLTFTPYDESIRGYATIHHMGSWNQEQVEGCAGNKILAALARQIILGMCMRKNEKLAADFIKDIPPESLDSRLFMKLELR